MAESTGYIEGRYFIWSSSNPCGSCFREMHRVGFPEEGKTPYHAKGMCSSCYQSKPPLVLISRSVPEGYRECIRCEQVLPSDTEFSINKSTLSGRSPWCKKCTTLNKFKMTRNDYDSMVLVQNGLCLICEKDPTVYGKVLVVDHDRSCCSSTSSCGSCVRGLLCTTCNSGLGFFGDSIDHLANASKYLKERTIVVKSK